MHGRNLTENVEIIPFSSASLISGTITVNIVFLERKEYNMYNSCFHVRPKLGYIVWGLWHVLAEYCISYNNMF